MTRTSGSKRPRQTVVLGLLFLWLASYALVRLYLDSAAPVSSSLRLGIAFIPTPIFGLFLLQYIRALRSADELERRIQLEALAVAFPLGLLLLTTLGLVQRAVELNFQDWSYNHIWPYLTLFYVAGLAVARKRYR